MKQQKGFTLVEILITTSILGILLSVAIPTFSYTKQKITADNVILQLQSSLNLARQTAISQKRSVVVCPSFNGRQCSGDGSSWSAGGIVFIDTDGDKQYNQVTELRGFLKRILPLRGENDLRSNQDYVSFSSYGMLNSSPQTFSYCDSGNNANIGRSLRISLQGRVSINDTSSCDS